jgi:subtilase family serine protease
VPCFQTLNTGKTPTPTDYATFAEISDDVEWAHVAAPGANIIVAQAPVTCKKHDPDQCGDPGATAIDTAIEKVVHAGATVVSMSFGDDDITQKQAFGWDQLDAAFVSGEGDFGYPAAGYPAADPAVLSVGGTVITNVHGTGADTAWKWAGGGLTKDDRPGYQINWTQSTDFREVNDVAYDAVNYPVRNLSPSSYKGHPWQVHRGVSLGIPQWAGLIADADQVRVADGRSILDRADSRQDQPGLLHRHHQRLRPAAKQGEQVRQASDEGLRRAHRAGHAERGRPRLLPRLRHLTPAVAPHAPA